ncbi:MAG TPA: hypothetical protein PKA90_03130 [Ignavibacteria bacterium]|nr:hypothetical protein [Ignavibacteria bacterium]HMR39402.1 hypothetical protein [Ignavibacteria bacterium]
MNNSTVIYGNNIENFELTNYTILKGNAILVQIEKDSADINNDTLLIYSDTMEAFRSIPDKYIARSNVEIIRGEFSAKCGEGIYYKNNETVSLYRKPVVWQDLLQMTGDSIYAELPDNRLQTIFVKKIPGDNSLTSFVISGNSDEYFSDRYDQISGDEIEIRFKDDRIDNIEVKNNSSSIYFLYEENKANGLNKVEGKDLYIFFGEDEKVSRIKVDTNPAGEYVPEQILNSTGLTLPGFDLREDKPVRR